MMPKTWKSSPPGCRTLSAGWVISPGCPVRYRWEDANRGNGSRVRAGLHFDGVLKVESQNVKRGAPDAVVSLLAIQFTPDGDAENPGGLIELQLAGGGGFRLTVECIDASLRDLTGPWAAIARPDHEDGK
jgi:hypothetical protein